VVIPLSADGNTLSAAVGGDAANGADARFEAALADRLVAANLIDRAGVERARRLQENSGDGLHLILTKLALVSERDMADALASELGQKLVPESEFPAEPVGDGAITPRFLKDHRVVPIAEENGTILLAMADPLDEFTRKALSLRLGRPVSARVAVPADIDAAIDRLYASGKSAVGQILEEITESGGDAAEDIARLKDLASEAPVIRLVNTMISRAVEMRASDIHLEPFEVRLRVRYRVDGRLHEVESPPNALRAAVISRVKIMAKLNIAERRLPQDGRIRIAVRGKEIDLRVSTLPGMHGESVVLRILDRGTVELDLATLGYEGAQLDRYLGILDRPNGILLVTGPTGHGKTTTLYASLRRLNTIDRKIHTVEDPIEYQLAGVTQIQVKPQIGLTFASILRSILRQNPDIVLVGEIRDLETAQISIQAALTGHLVLSTLHTNGAAASITRLLDMGVENYLLTATINGICAQRLVRKLCTHCREPYAPAEELARQMALDRIVGHSNVQLYRAVGCPQCHGTGYHGRTTISEVLAMSEEVRRLVLRRAEVADIARAAIAGGMDTMFVDGMRKAVAGITTPEEVLRVTRDM
jgi:general secretion pathway protein E